MDYKEKVIALLNDQELSKEQKEKLENIFPELKEKESENERIRKWLINEIKIKHHNLDEENIEFVDKAITWLENQGESDETKAKLFLINKGYPIDANGIFPTYEEMYNIIRDGLEEQGDNNPADKVEPKFKIGDWVVLTAGELSTTLQIVNVDANKKLYWFNDDSYLPIVDEECLHLWTIQDAKDGDVLACSDWLFILKQFNVKGNKHKTYCHYDLTLNRFKDDTDSYMVTGSDEFHPATKEQRDQLFQKMKEADYEWDSEKKELKKI